MRTLDERIRRRLGERNQLVRELKSKKLAATLWHQSKWRMRTAHTRHSMPHSLQSSLTNPCLYKDHDLEYSLMSARCDTDDAVKVGQVKCFAILCVLRGLHQDQSTHLCP